MIEISLTHWDRETHICVSKLTIIGSDNGLSRGRRQAIIWTNAGILLIRPLGTNFNEMLVTILTFSFMKMGLKVSSAKWRPFCLGLNVLMCDISLTPFLQPRLARCILVERQWMLLFFAFVVAILSVLMADIINLLYRLDNYFVNTSKNQMFRNRSIPTIARKMFKPWNLFAF